MEPTLRLGGPIPPRPEAAAAGAQAPSAAEDAAGGGFAALLQALAPAGARRIGAGSAPACGPKALARAAPTTPGEAGVRLPHIAAPAEGGGIGPVSGLPGQAEGPTAAEQAQPGMEDPALGEISEAPPLTPVAAPPAAGPTPAPGATPPAVMAGEMVPPPSSGTSPSSGSNLAPCGAPEPAALGSAGQSPPPAHAAKGAPRERPAPSAAAVGASAPTGTVMADAAVPRAPPAVSDGLHAAANRAHVADQPVAPAAGDGLPTAGDPAPPATAPAAQPSATTARVARGTPKGPPVGPDRAAPDDAATPAVTFPPLATTAEAIATAAAEPVSEASAGAPLPTPAGRAAPRRGSAAPPSGPGPLSEAAAPAAAAAIAAPAGPSAMRGSEGPAPPPPPLSPARQIAPSAVALSIGAGAAGGSAVRIELLLEPADLGRVEIRVEPGTGPGEPTAVRILAERPETLALLQRDARELDRALARAGLGADPAGGGCALSFALGGETWQGGNKDERGAASGGTPRPARAGPIDGDAPAGPAPPPARRPLLALLDIAV